MDAPPAEKPPQDPVQVKTVNFSDLKEQKIVAEDQADCEDETLPWDKTEEAILSDDAKLATSVGNEPPEPERKSSLKINREFYIMPSSIEKPLQDSGMSDDISSTKEEEDNQMPEVAKQVFVPHVQIAVGNNVLAQNQWNLDSRRRSKTTAESYELKSCSNENCDPEKRPFLSQDGPSSSIQERRVSQAARLEWPDDREIPQRSGCCGCKNCTSRSLKAVASFLGALVIFPCLLYGAYVFLPFDAPLMPGISTRLIYTLRCAVFATFPIVIGLIVYGISCLCFTSTDPFCYNGKSLGREKEVALHHHFVTQSVQLFVLYFFNMAVLATYLPQETLKLIPLLTGFFAISRLSYWLSFAVGRAFRGFGYGMTFLPLLAMLVCNLYFIFVMEPEKMFAMDSSGTPKAETQDPASKVRLWG